MEINWTSKENHLLLNPKMPSSTRQHLQSVFRRTLLDLGFHSCFGVVTSGSTSARSDEFKIVIIGKEAILSSAEAVNKHLQVTSKDVWLNALPLFHVGGLGVRARAFLSHSKFVDLEDFSWSAESFLRVVNAERITLTTLVPTQVFDLVQRGLPCPQSLRAVVVGGGSLDSELYRQARGLGFSLLPSYGLTESGSQIATASLSSLGKETFPRLEILGHAQIGFSESGRLKIKSNSLFRGYLYIFESHSEFKPAPLEEGWFETEDLAEPHGDSFRILGRGRDYIKVGGEAVNLSQLREQFQLLALKMSPALVQSLALTSASDSRLGQKVVLVQEVDETPELRLIVEEFNRQVLPFQRIKTRWKVTQIPKSELGKIKWGLLEGLEKEEI